MLKKYPAENHGRAENDWLKSLFHFSFDEYDNPDRVNFGALRVVNDDIIKPNTGFAMRPHRDMEIVSYVVDGQLSHGDSMGHKNTISRGHIQYMSAGTGIVHSEHNFGNDDLRLLQIWIYPQRRGLQPFYGDSRFDWSLRQNRLLHMVSPKVGKAPVQVNADVNLYALELAAGRELEFPLSAGRQVYLIQIEGASAVNGVSLQTRDAAEATGESLLIQAREKSHMLFIEMAKG